MQPEDRESLLFRLSELADPAERGPADVGATPASPSDAGATQTLLDDATLQDYRQGRLTDDEARRVEAQLIAVPANRRRLEELAGIALPVAPAGVRRRLLESTGRPQVRRRRRRWTAGLLAAAAGLAAVAGWTLLRPQLSLPTYEVQIAALAERRSAPPEPGAASSTAEAYAETMVVIDATVAEQAVRDVEVGLYRAAAERLERVAGDRLEVHQRRGAVRFKAPAAELVGPAAGDHEIFVVIAWKGDLPASVALEGSGGAAALAAPGLREVHRLTLRLLAPSQPPPP